MRFGVDEGNEWECDYACTKGFKEGKEAHEAGIKSSANPYPQKSQEAHDWSVGWKLSNLSKYIQVPMGSLKTV